jgi:Ca2+-binding EF-hand superfamily protein
MDIYQVLLIYINYIANEIAIVLQALGDDATDEEIDEMIRMLDLQGHGQVAYEEFFKMASGQVLYNLFIFYSR